MQVGVLGEFMARPTTDAPWSPAASAQVGKLGSVLACWPMEVVEDRTLVEALWGGKPPRTAENTLQVHVSRLRGLLGSNSAVVRRPHGYLLDVRPGDVDAEHFGSLLITARGHQHAGDLGSAAASLGEALSLWRGTPYVGAHGAEIHSRRTQLEHQRSLARASLAACRIRIADSDFERGLAIAQARGLLASDPGGGVSDDLRATLTEIGELCA